MCALLSLHVYTNAVSALRVCTLFFPYRFCAFLTLLLFTAHFAVNHGARCLSHLFGLVTLRWVDKTSTTPAVVACSSRNSSTRSALLSFVSVSSSMIALKAIAKSSVEECSFHFFALVPYDARHSPVCHWYRRCIWGTVGASDVAVFLGIGLFTAAVAAAVVESGFGTVAWVGSPCVTIVAAFLSVGADAYMVLYRLCTIGILMWSRSWSDIW
jgi:hypothetical protein